MNSADSGLKRIKKGLVNRGAWRECVYMYLKHHVMEDVVGKCFSFSTFTLKVVSELPDNMGHRLFSSSSEGGLVFF